jgi:hypothetical protein
MPSGRLSAAVARSNAFPAGDPMKNENIQSDIDRHEQVDAGFAGV